METLTINISDLNAKQKELWHKIVDTPPSVTKYHVLRASRQSGKSFLMLRLCLYFALHKKNNQHGAFISSSGRQFLDKYKDFLKIIPKEIIKQTSGGNTITFINNSVISFYTAKNYNAIPGPSFDFLVLDEVALYSSGALDIITPTIAAKKEAKVVMCSTPRGKNEFYTYCMNGNRVDNPYIKEYRMSYLDNDKYDLREIEEKKKTMREYVFSQEYLAEFIFSRGQVFGDFQHLKQNSYASYNPNHQYYAGIDWAGDGNDSTVLIIINYLGETILTYECESNNSVEQIKELEPILEKYHPLIFSEINGLGKPCTDMLLDIEAQKGTFRVHKFITTNESKGNLVTSFITEINTKGTSIRIPSEDLCPKLDNEMTMYSVSRTTNGALRYSHPDAPEAHDDYVMALLFAFAARRDDMPSGTMDKFPHIEDSVDEKIRQTFRLAEDMRNQYDLDPDDAKLVDLIW